MQRSLKMQMRWRNIKAVDFFAESICVLNVLCPQACDHALQGQSISQEGRRGVCRRGGHTMLLVFLSRIAALCLARTVLNHCLLQLSFRFGAKLVTDPSRVRVSIAMVDRYRMEGTGTEVLTVRASVCVTCAYASFLSDLSSLPPTFAHSESRFQSISVLIQLCFTSFSFPHPKDPSQFVHEFLH